MIFKVPFKPKPLYDSVITFMCIKNHFKYSDPGIKLPEVSTWL